ncbi:MAG: hypothetical protein BalsKO_12550 [Balneolaceae bacterium]
MGLVYMALSVACSLSIAHFLKLAKAQSLALVSVLVVNYLTASIISFTISGRDLTDNDIFEPSILIFSIALGVVFIANLFIYSASLNKLGMGI